MQMLGKVEFGEFMFCKKKSEECLNKSSLYQNVFMLDKLLRLGDRPASKNKRPLDGAIAWFILFWKVEEDVEENERENRWSWSSCRVGRGCMFCVRKGTAHKRTHAPYLCTPMHAHTLHLVSVIERGAACQLCPVPVSLTGNARGAGQTGHAKHEVGRWPAVRDGPQVGTYQTKCPQW